jgi:hypothetical protein
MFGQNSGGGLVTRVSGKHTISTVQFHNGADAMQESIFTTHYAHPEVWLITKAKTESRLERETRKPRISTAS